MELALAEMGKARAGEGLQGSAGEIFEHVGVCDRYRSGSFLVFIRCAIYSHDTA